MLNASVIQSPYFGGAPIKWDESAVMQQKGIHKVVQLPHKGPVESSITEILGGVRSACTYIGARRIKDMPKCTTFVSCNNQVNTVFNQYH